MSIFLFSDPVGFAPVQNQAIMLVALPTVSVHLVVVPGLQIWSPPPVPEAGIPSIVSKCATSPAAPEMNTVTSAGRLSVPRAWTGPASAASMAPAISLVLIDRSPLCVALLYGAGCPRG